MKKNNLNSNLQLVQQLIKNKNYPTLKDTLIQFHPVDVAELLENLSSSEEILLVFRLLHKDQAAEVFSHLKKESQADLVAIINPQSLTDLLAELDFDDKIDFLEEMPANFVKKVITTIPKSERTLINQFLNYPENSAGSLMTIEYVDLKKQMTVAQALEKIKAIGADKITIYTCYVIDETRKLVGTVSLRNLVLAAPSTKLTTIIDQEELISVKAQDDQEEIATLFKKYDLSALPVVDKEQRMIGIITVDDIIDVIEEENTEDMQKMAAMAPSDEEYLDTKVFTLARKRVVWLLILMVSATLTGGIISHYESLLSSAVVLTAFIPMLMDSGGNAGSQSSTLIIRGIALGEIKQKDWLKVLWKELRVSFLVGLTLAVVNACRMLIFSHSSLALTLTVSITLLLTIVAAKIVGGILPLIAKALKLDPAIMAGPLITTIVDAFSLIIYFGIAGWLII